jgi:chaperonin GroEL
MPLLDKIMRAPRPLIIIAENVEGTALQHARAQPRQRRLPVRRGAGPGFGDRRLHKLEDIAAITGGAVYSRHSGFTLETMTLDQLGRADQVRVNADRTAIIGGGGSRDASSSGHPAARRAGAGHFGVDEDVLTERIGALSGKVAVIRVGAPTPPSSRSCSTGSRTRCPRPGPRWPRASSPAAARRCCTPRRAGRPAGQGRLRDRRRDRAAALTEPAFLIAANAGYSGQEVVARCRTMGPDEGSTRCRAATAT